MSIIQTNLTLNKVGHRKYIQGAHLLQETLPQITKHYPYAVQFRIRFKQPLVTQPVLTLTDEHELVGNAFGSFIGKGKTIYFSLLPTEVPCENKEAVDEAPIKDRIYEDEFGWSIDLQPTDDFHHCFNVLSKTTSLKLFSRLPHIEMSTEKQTWFVGCEFFALELLSQSLSRVSVSRSNTLLTPVCMKRDVKINDVVIGSRTTIYK